MKSAVKVKSLLRGIFLTSVNAERTATFYRIIAGLELEQIGVPGGSVYWKCDNEGVQLAIHDAETFAEYSFPPQVSSNVTHLYFKVENQELFLAHLKEFNIETFAIDDVVVTVVDPDGRNVMFGTA